METITIVLAIIALGIGCLVTYLVMKAKNASLLVACQKHDEEVDSLRKALTDKETELSTAKSYNTELISAKSATERELELTKHQVEETTNALQKQEQKSREYENELSNTKALCEGKQKELELLRERQKENLELSQKANNTIAQLQKDLEASLIENADIQSQRDTAQKEVGILKEQMQHNKEEQAKAIQQQLEMAKEQLQNATQEILKQREESLGKANVEQIGNVVTPLKEQLEAIQKQVTESIKTTTDNKASLERAIEDLMKQTKSISDDANNLTRALRNESKTQGTWGEMILEQLLENSGLVKDVHYELQSTLRDASGKIVTHDETGKRLIPDVIVHYPDGKDCIIDSKVSLNDFVDYCNAENPEDKEKALARHVMSVKKHVKELLEKDYSSYIKVPRTATNYVIMFVPNESAMQLALHEDSTLWHYAFDKGVCITSEQNLLVLLRMIQMAWIQVQQAQNQQEVFDQARKLLDRVADFIERFNKIGEQIGKASETFSSAKDKLYNGQQSIIKAAKDMEKLGAKTSPKKQLPEAQDWNPIEAESADTDS